MSSEKRNVVHLSGREAMYLKNAAFLPDELARVVDTAKDTEDNGVAILLSPEISGRLREVLTERLAKVGFDEAYRPTSEGKVLEALIDRFHVR